MACNITIINTEPKVALIEKLKNVVESNEGTFNGDENQGNITVSTPIGNVEATYQIAGDDININVSSKPFLVSCNTIEEKLREFLQTPI
jgi:hypothetical protein